ncbi:MAG: cyclic nucleotide-binding domain-containing protein, partial [Planctomycetaceae bacterium]|nr:cyclic nucleotide-binding domain-containing protein [Planctomycetaceae bacterium]
MSEATGNGSFSEGRLPEAKAINIKTEIRLEERPGDSVMDAGSLKAFSLFNRLRKPVPVEKYPGSIVLRRYRAGDVVCRQGEPGFSAFYVPTAEDLKRWTGNPASPSVDLDGSQEISSLPQQVLTAYIFQGTSTARRRGFLRRLVGRSPKRKRVDITEIPNDGPTDIDAETRQAPILEGDVFGEMSCMTFAPRSATIVAKQDCRLMEFNRNIFDQLQKDEEYRKWNNAIYVERVLNSHLRRLELFSDLNPDQLEELKSGVTLEVVEPGALICEEGESPADHALDVFIVRSGVVQVARNVSVSLKSKDIRDWKTLCQQMVASASAVQSAEKPEMGPAVVPGSPENPFPGDRPATKSSELPIDEGLTNSLLRSRLPEVLGDHRHVVYAWLNDDIQQAICRLAEDENSTEEDRELILEGLNALIRSRDYLLTLQMQPVFQRPEVLRRISSFPNGVKGIKKDWSDMDVRTTARFLIADAFPDAVRSKEESTAPPRVLAYLSRGDCFGEIAVVRKEPRGASCIAYDHPPDSSGRRPGRVELVRISGKVFEKLMEDSHELRSRVLKLAGERIQRDASTTEATAGAAAMTA